MRNKFSNDNADFLKPSDCPRSVSNDVREAWASILKIAPRRLTKADSLTVLNASRLLVEIQSAEQLIAERGRDVESSGRAMQSPWAVRLQACLGTWLKYSKALGLDPMARAGNPTMQEKLLGPDDIHEFLSGL